MAGEERSDLDSGDLVVVDTNILDFTNLLMSQVAISLLFYLEKAEVGLGLHEVIKQEWREHFIESFKAKWNDASRAEIWLNTVAGIQHLLPAMDPESLAQKAFSRRLTELSEITETILIRKDHWQQAGQMVIDKRPPSKKGSQQFKDSLIWRGLLHEGQNRRVVFVTQDKGFTDGHGGLEPTLAAEAIDAGAQIEVVGGLPEVLEMLRQVTRDVADQIGAIVDTLRADFKDAVDEVLETDDLETGDERIWDVEYFATSNPGEVTAVVVVEYDLRRQDEPDLWEDIAYVEVEGAASIEAPDSIVSIEIDSMKTVLLNPHKDVVDWVIGGQVRQSSVHLRRVQLDIAVD